MKIIIYRDKKTNKITSYHEWKEACTDEAIKKYNANEKYDSKAECVEIEEDSVAHYFYLLKTNTIEDEAENLRELMRDIRNIADRIDDRLYDFDRWMEENGSNE